MSYSPDYEYAETKYLSTEFSTIYTNDSSTTDFPPITQPSYVVPVGFNAILLGGTLLIITVGLIANASVLFIVMFEQFRKSPNSPVHTINTYITNLASADFLYIFVSIFWAITNYDQSGWKFGDFGCRGVYFLEYLTLHASAYILTVMTIERYLAIIYPMSSMRFRNITVARIVSTCVWISAVIIALPTLFVMKVDYIQLGKSKITKLVCDCSLGIGAFNSYYSAVAVITFVIPSVLMITIYSKMFAHLYVVMRKDIKNEVNENTCQMKNYSHRAAKSVFIIVIVWLVCFFPFWLNQFLYMYTKIYDEKTSFPMITTTTGLLAYLNSTLNPFLYTLLPRRHNVWKKLRPKPPLYEYPQVGFKCSKC